MSFKKCKVVMLPTNEKAIVGSIVTRPSDNRMATVNVLTINDPQPCVHQHLYFLSDEEIKEGDWMYNPEREPSILQCVGKGSLRGWKKIIATTDRLNMHPNIADSYRSGNCLPQPSQSFIEKFVEEYNKGNVITEVMVEYENIDMDFDPTEQNGIKWQTILKINPKDNTITIRKVKDSWNRDEVIELLKSRESHIDCHTYSKQFIDKQEYRELDKWIQENL